MKCLLCNEWIEPVAQLSDLIMFKQRREYSCEDCKAQFKKLGKARCSNCYKIIDGNSCFDCKIWAKKGYIPKHFAIYQMCIRDSPTAASRRSLGRVSVPVWPITLSGRLCIVA